MLRELGGGAGGGGGKGGVLEEVGVDELPGLVLSRAGHEDGDEDEDEDMERKVYIVRVKPEDYLVRKDSLTSLSSSSPSSLSLSPSSPSTSSTSPSSKPTSKTNFVPSYTRPSYHASPSAYTSVFMERVGRYLSVLVNGVGWAEGYPRLVGWDAVNKEGEGEGGGVGMGRLMVVGDISCDLEVSRFSGRWVPPTLRWLCNWTFCFFASSILLRFSLTPFTLIPFILSNSFIPSHPNSSFPTLLFVSYLFLVSFRFINPF
ncbi:hypothetical protein F5880DRAFT_1574583 [Lentinula raphanica]|nr:hypothetical protein F5880DRAFT_1574583 [Lentinula raphanica]